MNVPLLTWSCVVGLFIAMIVFRIIYAYGYCSCRKHHVIEIGSEREEMFIPGDKTECQDEYDDYDCGKDY